MASTSVPGPHRHGFSIERDEALNAIQGRGILAVHQRTGARLLHLAADDPEMLFAVAFPTPPADNTGVAHIIEHTVLNGSERFPVKDPFVEMLKSSMATFINAMTYADRTVYPVASTVRKDFFNLVDVYLDAVFHPLIDHEAFQQEGWHWETRRDTPETGDRRLGVNGVVFNEMRGAFSDPDGFMERETAARLFPLSTYGCESGGEPRDILDLSFTAFRRFYRRHYHPANAYMVVYGGVETDAVLHFVGARLDSLSPPPFVPPTFVLEPRWSTPREAQLLLPPTGSTGTAGMAAVTMNWVIGKLGDPITDLLWQILDWLLLGDDSAPLRRGLLESGIGHDLTASGYDSHLLQTTFQIGMKECLPGQKGALCHRIRTILEQTARQGFPSSRCRDALRQAEYAQRDTDSGYPLHLMDEVINAWLYGFDPLQFVKIDLLIQGADQRIRKDPTLFSRMIRRGLLENPHCLTLEFDPATSAQTPRQLQLRAHIRDQQKRFGPEGMAKVEAQAQRLATRQNTPNSPQALASLPRLTPRDVPEEPTPIQTEISPQPNGLKLLRSDVFCNDVTHVQIAFDLSDLPAELLPYVPVYASIFNRMGTAGRSYTEVSEAIATQTGHLAATLQVTPDLQQPEAAIPLFMIQLRTLDDTAAGALSLMNELLFELTIDDRERLQNVLRQRRVRLISSAAQRGQVYAVLHAARHMSRNANLNALWRGIPQLRLAHRLGEDFERQIAGLLPALQRLQTWLADHPGPIASITGTDLGADLVRGWLTQWRGGTQAQPRRNDTQTPSPDHDSRQVDAFSCDADVCFCASSLPAPSMASTDAPLLQIAAQLLSYDYFWEQIRAQGGAYGASLSYDRTNACLSMTSYRDPFPARTLALFDDLPAAVEACPWSEDEIQQAIIACARDDQTPVRPAMAIAVALLRHIAHIDQPWRRQWRQRLCEATADTTREVLLQQLRKHWDQRQRAVLGSREALTELENCLDDPLRIESLVD